MGTPHTHLPCPHGLCMTTNNPKQSNRILLIYYYRRFFKINQPAFRIDLNGYISFLSPFYSPQMIILLPVIIFEFGHFRVDFWFFKHLKMIENRRLELVQPCLDHLFRWLQFRWLNWNSLKGDQGKAAPNPIVYFQSP